MANDERQNKNTLHTTEAANGDEKKVSYPKGIPFIIVNEFCERFNNHGIRSILALYMTWKLAFDENTSMVVYHSSQTLIYFCCLVGAVIADNWWGNYNTVVILSILSSFGSCLMTFASVDSWNLPIIEITLLGIFLKSFGTGAIKSCITAFGADQFKLPEQAKQLTTFFSLFYFSMVGGGLIGSFVTPILRKDVHCLGSDDCFPLAFGVPTIFMLLSVVVFLMGNCYYKRSSQRENMFLKVCGYYWFNFRAFFQRNLKHDIMKNFDEKLRREASIVKRVLVLFLPVPIFWSLYDQQASRWIFQASRMNNDIGFMEIKPDHMLLLQSVLVMLFIPLSNIVIYPLLKIVGIERPLQKMAVGGISLASAFVLSGIVEIDLQSTEPSYLSHINILNGMPCLYSIRTNIPNTPQFEIQPHNYFDKFIKLDSNSVTFNYELSTNDSNCPTLKSGNFTVELGNSFNYILTSFEQGVSLQRISSTYDEFRDKTVSLRILSSDQQNLTEDENLERFRYYRITVEEPSMVENFLKVKTSDRATHILWQIPQHVFMALSEVLFAIPGLEFSFTQAPQSMKSVLMGFWYLTVAFGNIVTIVIASTGLFTSQITEYFMYAGLMFVDMLLFIWLAYRYKPISGKDLQINN